MLKKAVYRMTAVRLNHQAANPPKPRKVSKLHRGESSGTGTGDAGQLAPPLVCPMVRVASNKVVAGLAMENVPSSALLQSAVDKPTCVPLPVQRVANVGCVRRGFWRRNAENSKIL
jgi:hypothetical protein